MQNGKIGVILVIIALTVSCMGGFILNAEDVTSCTTEYSYVTDVSGAFSGTNADIEVDYNPQTNLTGYSVFSPTSTDTTVNTIHGINYTRTNANGYWIQENTGNVSKSTVTLTNNKSTSGLNPGTAAIQWDSNAATNVTIDEKYGLTGNPATEMTSGDLTFSRVVAIPLSSFMGTYPASWNTDNVVLSFANTNNSFPCFIVDAGWNDHRVGNGMTGYYSYEITYTDLSTEIKVNPTTATTTINGTDYSYSQVMVVWGGANTTVATMNAYIGSMTATYYVDPSQGIQPASVHTSNVEIVTTTSNSQSVHGHIGIPYPRIMTGTAEVNGTVTMDFGSDLSIQVFQYDIKLTSAGNLQIWIDNVREYNGVISYDSDDYTTPIAFLDWQWDFDNIGAIKFWYQVATPDSSNISETKSIADLQTNSSMITSVGGVSNVNVSLTTTNNATGTVNTITNVSSGSSNTTVGTSNNYSTIITSTHTDTVTRDYETTYWDNGYHNTSISMLIPKTNNLENDFYVWTNNSSTDSSTKINVKYDGSWTIGVNDTISNNYGNWSAIMVYLDITGGKLVISVVPVQVFNTFLDYTLIQNVKYVVYSSDSSDNKYIHYLSFPTSNTQFYHEIVDTTVLLEEGGLYIQDGMFSPAISFPNDNLIEFKVMSAAHFGDSMTITTGNSTPNSITLTADTEGYWTYDSKSYKMADVSVYYADESVESVGIGGLTYDGGIYLKNKFYEKGHLYIQMGKNADLMDLGVSDKAWSVILNGTWAVSTAYYTGSNVADSYTDWSEPGTWQWSQEEFLMVFIGIMLIGLILCAWKFEMKTMDWIASVGSIVVVYILMGGI